MEAKKTIENNKTISNNAPSSSNNTSQTKSKRFANTLLNQFRTRRKRQKKSKSLQSQENGVNRLNCFPNKASIQACSHLSNVFHTYEESNQSLGHNSRKSFLSDNVCDPFCFVNDSTDSKAPSYGAITLKKNDNFKCSSLQNQTRRKLKIGNNISTPIFRNSLNRNAMINHPLHLLRERALGKSRDKRRHSSASTPSFMLTNPLIISSSNSNINPYIFRLLCHTKLIKRKECIHHDLDQVHHHTTKTQKLSLNRLPYDLQAKKNKPLWKKQFLRSVPFSELNTCFSQAILSVDRTGSYLISVGPPSCLCDFASIRKSSIYQVLHRSTSHSSCSGVKNMQPILFIPKLTLSYFSIPSPETLYQQKKETIFQTSTELRSLTSNINYYDHNTLHFHAGNSKERSTVTSPLVFGIPLQMERRILSSNSMSQGYVHQKSLF